MLDARGLSCPEPVIMIRKAIIPAAGLGTRVLPASKAVPKEMLPIVDKPAIQYIVEEAVNSGIEDILIITNRGKTTVEDHFDRAPELEQRLLASGKTQVYEEMVALSRLANIQYVNAVILTVVYIAKGNYCRCKNGGRQCRCNKGIKPAFLQYISNRK